MIYFDVSYIVRLYFEDPGWEKVRDLAAQAPLACSLHGRAEAAGAMHRKLREGVLTPLQYRHLLKQFAVDCRPACLPLDSFIARHRRAGGGGVCKSASIGFPSGVRRAASRLRFGEPLPGNPFQ